MEPKKLLFVAGARPNFMKIAPILRAVQNAGSSFLPVLVHTGQHYDPQMSDVFFSDLGIPTPDYFLDVRGGSHAVQTARVMEAFEPVLLATQPELIIVVGDVNSTLAAALVGKKLQFPVAHVEAGLRSRDMSMPEEINRVLVDSISDLLFVSEPSGVKNLQSEGRSLDDIHLVGNVMVDTLFHQVESLSGWPLLEKLGLQDSRYAVLTIHRPATVDHAEILAPIADVVNKISLELPVVFPVHPRTRAQLERFGICFAEGVVLLEPQGYRDFLALWSNSALVLTDSGGLQEETSALGVPCITLRENTERPITVESGTNIIAGLSPDKIFSAFKSVNQYQRRRCSIELWDGRASERILEVLESFVNA